MLQNINVKSNVSVNRNNDSVIAKNIIDVLFVFIDSNIRNDGEMNGFTKGLILSQLPGIRKGSKDYVDKSSVNMKKLLDDIQNHLENRK